MTLRHIIFNLQKMKGQEKKSRRNQRKTEFYLQRSWDIIPDFPSESMQIRREWGEIFKELREKTYKPRILYPANYPSKIKKNTEFLKQTTVKGICSLKNRSVLLEMLKLLREEGSDIGQKPRST